MILRLSLLACCCFANVGSAAPPITAAAFAPDGQQVLIGSQAGIEIRNWPDLKSIGTVGTDLANVHDLAFSPDGQTLLVAGGAPGERGTVDIIRWPEKKQIHRVNEHQDLVYRVAWSPDGEQFATAGADGVCQVFFVQSGKCVTRFAGHSRAVLAIVFLPDGKSILSAGVDQTLQVWECDTGKSIRSFDNHLAAINDLAVRPTTNRAAPPVIASVSDDRTVRLWQPTIGRMLRFARLPSSVRCLAWSTDGMQIVVGCNDGTMSRINPETAAASSLEQALTGRIHGLLAAPEGHWLVSGEGNQLRAMK